MNGKKQKTSRKKGEISHARKLPVCLMSYVFFALDIQVSISKDSVSLLQYGANALNPVLYFITELVILFQLQSKFLKSLPWLMHKKEKNKVESRHS